MLNNIKSHENLCKEEILDIVDMMLDVLSTQEDFRPVQSDYLRDELAKAEGNQIPDYLEKDIKEHEAAMEKFMNDVEVICKQKFEKDYKRLKHRYPSIVKMILRYGEHADLIRLRRMLDLNELMEKKHVSPLRAEYQVGQELRNTYVNPRLNIKENQINEINPDTIDLEKIKRNNPSIFK